jgi:thiol:disulfide interchange protein
MKTKLLFPCLLCVLSLLAAFPESTRAGDEPKPAQAPIYDESANASQQIADALVIAKRDNKHVLLQFGANWCSWCHKLHNLYESDKNIAEELKLDYVVVMVDVNKNHNSDLDTKYGHPIRFGLPVIVILDSNGKPLTTEDSGKLEEGDHHNPEKVISFLKQWAPAHALHAFSVLCHYS